VFGALEGPACFIEAMHSRIKVNQEQKRFMEPDFGSPENCVPEAFLSLT
jgi:hypothetical protein